MSQILFLFTFNKFFNYKYKINFFNSNNIISKKLYII